MTRSLTWRLAWSVWVLTLFLYAAGVAIQQVNGYPTATQQDSWPPTIALLLAFVAFATIGALVAAREPRNAVGWIFLAIAFLVGLSVAGGEYANYVFVENPGSYPGGYLAGWLYLWTWNPVLPLIVVLPFLFPDGRPPGPRWRPALRAIVAVTLFVTVVSWIQPGPMNESKQHGNWPDNPIGVRGFDRVVDVAMIGGWLCGLLFLVVSVSAMVVRFRRSRGDERQQLKWMTYGACVMAFAFALEPFAEGDQQDFLLAFAIVTLPAAAAIAIFRYRLYEVDRVISRTLVYGSLSVILGLAYAGLVLAGQAVFSSFAGGSNLAIAGSTLVVAALFLPARSRVQRFVDRRFYRRRYDAQRTLDAFGARLRQEVDIETLTTDLRGVIGETVQPAHLSIWVRTTA